MGKGSAPNPTRDRECCFTVYRAELPAQWAKAGGCVIAGRGLDDSGRDAEAAGRDRADAVSAPVTLDTSHGT